MGPASCQCGQLKAEVSGEPVRVSICHCLACQKRGGGPFAAQARFEGTDVKFSGEEKKWTRLADSGQEVEHHFCPNCGSLVWYHSRPNWDLVAIPVGAFADPDFPPPKFSVYEARQHSWVVIDTEVEHYD